MMKFLFKRKIKHEDTDRFKTIASTHSFTAELAEQLLNNIDLKSYADYLTGTLEDELCGVKLTTDEHEALYEHILEFLKSIEPDANMIAACWTAEARSKMNRLFELYNEGVNAPKCETVKAGEYNGFKYFILWYRNHPNAYIKIPKGHPFYEKDHNEIDDKNCGAIVNYGEHLFMVGGYLYCSTDGCREKLLERHNGHNSIS